MWMILRKGTGQTAHRKVRVQDASQRPLIKTEAVAGPVQRLYRGGRPATTATRFRSTGHRASACK